MRLYHGTNVDFDKIDIRKSQKHKDFGQGFYLTDILEQARRMAQRKANLYGGVPVVQQYEVDEQKMKTCNILRFEKPTEEWAEFISKNREWRRPAFNHPYDIVIGPIADDGVAYLLGRYSEGTMTLTELARELEYRHLNRQYFFGTAKAIALLKRIK